MSGATLDGRRLACLALLATLAGCPHRSPYAVTGDGGMDDDDAGPGGLPDARPIGPIPDAAPRADARPGGGAADASTGGGIPSFPSCSGDAECAAGSDCRNIPWLGTTEKQCIPRCDSTADCPFSTYCYPTGGGSLGPSFALMGDHCWYSLCGEAFGPVGGETGGPCQLGAEAGVPSSDLRPGWCMPIDDTYFGQCLEVGSLPIGSVCDFSVQVRGGANCDVMTVCIGDAGAATGTCALRCDPTQILAGGATGCAPFGQGCLDSSNILVYSDGSVARQTIGYCTDVDACGLIGPNMCGPSPSGESQGCVSSNSLRPTGVCDPSGTGALSAGAMCAIPAPSSDSGRCVAGTQCYGADTSGTCQTICKRSHACMSAMDCPQAMDCSASHVCTLPYYTGPDAACPPGSTCTGVFWNDGFDYVPGTADDTYTYDWGTCQ